MGHLNELNEKYFAKGLRIIGVSKEPTSKIKSIMIDDLGAKYWMASDPSGDMLSFFGGGGIPHAYLIDSSGKIVADMHPGSLKDDQIEALLAKVFKPELERDLHPSLGGLVKQYNKGQYGKAFGGAERYVESEERGLSDDAKYLREKCEEVANFNKKVIEDAIEGKLFSDALDDLKELPKTFAGMPVADWAKETESKLKADPAVAMELKAWKAYESARSKEQKAKGKAKKLGPAVKAYEKVAKKFPGTRAAAMAEKAAEKLNKFLAGAH